MEGCILFWWISNQHIVAMATDIMNAESMLFKNKLYSKTNMELKCIIKVWVIGLINKSQ